MLDLQSLLLAIDVGNSRIKFGLFNADACAAPSDSLPECFAMLASPIAEEVPWHEIRAWAEQSRATDVRGVVAGANPQGIARVCDTWPERWTPPHVISDPTRLPIETRLLYPRRVGIDRLLNAVAANRIRSKGRGILIVDSGTATTVDLVGAEGHFEGGAILPGFELCARSLHYYTALLPLISMDELATQPHDPLGRETRAALRSGLFWGQLGAVKELIERLSKHESRMTNERGVPAEPSPNSSESSTLPPELIFTGGGTSLLMPHFPGARGERYLSLQGLALSAVSENGTSSSR